VQLSLQGRVRRCRPRNHDRQATSGCDHTNDMSLRRKLGWLALLLLLLFLFFSSTPRFVWTCKTIAPGTPADAARESLAAAGAYCNDPKAAVWTTWAASPTCACRVAADRTAVVTEALLACTTAPPDFQAACDAVKVGDRLVEARKGLDATGYPASQESRGFACYVTFVACGVGVDTANRVTETRLARMRR
jgi:hypothetical protein